MMTLNERVTRRKEIYEYYRNAFVGLPVKMQPILRGCTPNYWLSNLTINKSNGKKPDDIISYLETQNIEARRMWFPMHCQPVFTGLEYYMAGGESVSKDIFDRGICLPSGSAMTTEDLERVCKAFSEAFEG
jgi:dTDP-4-amino-4,6-dideoxygalactose transaminase